jgi:hypothetical protein
MDIRKRQVLIQFTVIIVAAAIAVVLAYIFIIRLKVP